MGLDILAKVKNVLGHDRDVAEKSPGNSPTGKPAELAVT
jgi:hypothetical protein